MNQFFSFFSVQRNLVAHVAGWYKCHAGWTVLRALSGWSLSTTAQAQTQSIDLLAQVKATFGQRLETTLRYQEAVEFERATAITRSVQIGKHATDKF